MTRSSSRSTSIAVPEVVLGSGRTPSLIAASVSGPTIPLRGDPGRLLERVDGLLGGVPEDPVGGPEPVPEGREPLLHLQGVVAHRPEAQRLAGRDGEREHARDPLDDARAHRRGEVRGRCDEGPEVNGTRAREADAQRDLTGRVRPPAHETDESAADHLFHRDAPAGGARATVAVTIVGECGFTYAVEALSATTLRWTTAVAGRAAAAADTRPEEAGRARAGGDRDHAEPSPYALVLHPLLPLARDLAVDDPRRPALLRTGGIILAENRPCRARPRRRGR